MLFPLNLGKLAQVIGGRIVRGNPRTPVLYAVHGSTRYLRPGAVHFFRTGRYVPRQLGGLRGRKSAGVVVPSGWQNRIPAHHAVIVVPNAYQALWKLTHWQRAQSRAVFIGITGSAGKTTTKEMTASVLMQKYKVMKSIANNNVAQCLPSNLMHLNGSHQVAVLEMGMASLGNIRQQCAVAKPSIGVVTNVGEAHVGSLGNSLSNVVRAKQELVDGIVPGGTLLLNADDPGSRKLSLRNFKGKVITFGIKNKAQIRAEKVTFRQDGMRFTVNGVRYFIPTWGKHNVYNALAAIVLAKIMKVPTPLIKKGLKSYSTPYMRLQRLPGTGNRILINDAYNANPTSMIAGLRVLKRISEGRYTVAVLGDMHELGIHSAHGHAKVGQVVVRLKPSQLITIGAKASQIAKTAIANGYPRKKVFSCSNLTSAYIHIQRTVPKGAILYFKASRTVEMEKLIRRLRQG
jgi:UDP-N-acetylmuramoyl-tripeptide--D-alanyl-D-alanine ligase